MTRTANLTAILVLLTAPLPSAAFGAQACTAVAGPTGAGPWFVSADQTPGGELVIFDVLGEALLWMAPGESSLTRVAGPVADLLPEVRPVQIRAVSATDLLLQLAGTETESFARLDRSFALHLDDAREVVGSVRGDGREIRSTWIWEPAGDDRLVACSDLVRAGDDRQPTEGLVRLALDRPSDFELLLEMPFDAPMRFACRLALPLITVLDDGAVYALVPGNGAAGDPRFAETRLYRAAAGGGAAVALGEPLGEWPELPTSAKVTELPWVMREIELAAMPTGLYHRGQWLYLLHREPLAGGGTDWSLTRIDPATGEAAGTMRISSQANHLMVVPGPERWALIEKGPVRSFGYQELRRIVWLPVAQLDGWRDGGILCAGQ